MFRNFLEVDVQELPRSRCSETSSKSMFRNFLEVDVQELPRSQCSGTSSELPRSRCSRTSSKSMFSDFLDVDVQELPRCSTSSILSFTRDTQRGHKRRKYSSSTCSDLRVRRPDPATSVVGYNLKSFRAQSQQTGLQSGCEARTRDEMADLARTGG